MSASDGGTRPADPPQAPSAVRTSLDPQAPAGGPDPDGPPAAPARRRWRREVRRRREALRANPRRNHLYRMGVATLGTVVVLLGLALVPLPGPGWVVVFLGLAVLGSEFHSARRLNAFGRRQLHRWVAWVERRSWRTRIGLGGGTAAVVVAVVWGWFAWQGVPTWSPEVVTAQLQRVPGIG
ncbi:TIGR02611 family protein [Kineococcus sp. R8]|uniref:TIGR02611 family protein n=1 Tax=Kineococcus siccus TaxID=2696567 RepID=UPI0014121B75|nr:TIGR02611 family protein [Kineococcus siccus]